MYIKYENGKKVLWGLTDEEKKKLQKDLTFKNPQYESIMRYSKWGNTRVSPYLKYYEKRGNFYYTPMGYGVQGELVADKRLSLDISYPQFALELRDLQKQAVAQFKEQGTLVLQTGTGKTICGLYLAGKLKQRVLVVVNKDDLVDGWTKDVKLCYGDIEVGLVKGKAFKIGEQITITTIQTLSRLGDKKLAQLFENISMLITDEVHHAGASTYKVLNSFPAKYRLGLTATKMRNDGLADVIELLCGKEIFNGTNMFTEDIIPAKDIHIIRQDIDIVWYARKHYYDTKTKKDVKIIRKEGVGDFSEGELEFYRLAQELEAKGLIQAYPLRLHEAYDLMAHSDSFNSQICSDVKRAYDKGKSCVVFCKTIEQIDALYEMLKPCCPKIQRFYGNMKETKAEIKERAESKEALITLATISIACEGTNVKAWEYGFLVSSVANEKDLIQILGRLRRTKEDKKEVYFYDYRFPRMTGIRNHGAKRDTFYKNLGIFS